MEKLFLNYRFPDIVLFIIIFVFAIKELVTILDWYRKRFSQDFVAKDEAAEKEKEEKLEERLKHGSEKMANLEQEQIEIKEQLKALNNNIQLLLDSDRDDIKSWITEKHNFFVKQGYIDTYSLDCIEKRYAHYKEENGNSFIRSFMKDIRELPVK